MTENGIGNRKMIEGGKQSEVMRSMFQIPGAAQ